MTHATKPTLNPALIAPLMRSKVILLASILQKYYFPSQTGRGVRGFLGNINIVVGVS